jgi:hypothetical protein
VAVFDLLVLLSAGTVCIQHRPGKPSLFRLAWPTLPSGLKTASFVWIEQKSYKIGIKRLKKVRVAVDNGVTLRLHNATGFA